MVDKKIVLFLLAHSVSLFIFNHDCLLLQPLGPILPQTTVPVMRMIRTPIHDTATDRVPTFATHHAPGTRSVRGATNEQVHGLVTDVAFLLTQRGVVGPSFALGSSGRLFGLFGGLARRFGVQWLFYGQR